MKICAYCKFKNAKKGCEDVDDFDSCKDWKEKFWLVRSFVDLGNGMLLEQVMRDNIPMYAIWDGNKVVNYVLTYGNYRPVLERDAGDRIFDSCVLLPTDITEYGTTEALLNEVRDFIHKYFDFDTQTEIIATYYTLFTYVYDKFTSVCYMRFTGDTGTGKSRACHVVGQLCYRPILLGGAVTPAPIYRVTTWFMGTLILPEGDISGRGEYDADLTKILNQGAMRDEPVVRCNPTNVSKVDSFDPYCPKVIGTRQKYEDVATESRCLTRYMMGKSGKRYISSFLPVDMKKEATLIRNKLTLFRLRHYKNASYEHLMDIDKTLKCEDRIKQVMLPLFSVINNDQDKADLMKFLEEYNRGLVEERSQTQEGMVLDFVSKLRKKHRDVWIDELHTAINATLAQQEQLSTQKLGKILRGLGLQTKRVYDKGSGGRRRKIDVSEDVLRRIFDKYGITDRVSEQTEPSKSTGKQTQQSTESSIDVYSNKLDVLKRRSDNSGTRTQVRQALVYLIKCKRLRTITRVEIQEQLYRQFGLAFVASEPLVRSYLRECKHDDLSDIWNVVECVSE